MSVVSAIRDTVPISLFNKGQAGKIFEQTRQTGAKVVMKNNAAQAVIISPEEYLRLIDEANDALLEAEALRRMVNFSEEHLRSEQEFLSEFAITESDLADIDSIEIE